MNELALFAGAGGCILGGKLLGWRTVCAVEIVPYCRSVLLARQRDGCLPGFPIWDDVRTFDGHPWRGYVDVISGGFPCQDISSAGKGAGIEGARSGLWVEMARIVREVRPRFVFVENSPMLTSRGLGVVLGDLATMGFDARWGVLGADDVGAPHRRKRIWIAACRPDRKGESTLPVDDETPRLCGDASHPDGKRGRQEQIGELRCSDTPEFGDDGESVDVADTEKKRLPSARRGGRVETKHARLAGPGWWQTEPDVGRVANGVASRVDRIRAIGNGQIPAVAALAWRTLRGG